MKFELGQNVTHKRTGKAGTIVGRAEYAEKPSSYLVRYTDEDGEVEQWWTESAIE